MKRGSLRPGSPALLFAVAACGGSAAPAVEAVTPPSRSQVRPIDDGAPLVCFLAPAPGVGADAQAKAECDASIDVINRGVDAFGSIADLLVMAEQMDRVAADACALRIQDEGLLDLMQSYRAMAIKVSTTLRRIDAAIRTRDVETLQAMDGVMARATSVEDSIVEGINQHCSALAGD